MDSSHQASGGLAPTPGLDTGLRIIECPHCALGSVYLSGEVRSDSACREALRVLEALGATPVHQEVFGPRDALRTWPTADWPVTCVLAVAPGGPVSTQIHAVRKAPVSRLTQGGKVLGSLYEAGGVRYCRVGGVTSEDGAALPGVQTRETLEGLERVLAEAGMAYTDVARTWFYNDRILDWYGEFNGARDIFYRERGVFDGLIPASTGIGGANLQGAALTAGLLAAVADSGTLDRKVVASPLQDTALAYGSSFSRAMELGLPGQRELFVSGTASITPDGLTAHLDDVTAQIDLTMRVVAAILESRGMTWDDVCHGMAYVPSAGYLEDYRAYLKAQGMPGLPLVEVVNTVCRDNLLFEVEVAAMGGGAM